MITKSPGYTTSDNQWFGDLEKAQDHEIEITISLETGSAIFIETLRKHRDKIIDILTTNAKSRPRARRVNKPKVQPAEKAKTA